MVVLTQVSFEGHQLSLARVLHNPSYDFNDELIPLGATLWVKLARAWLAQAAG